MSEAVRASTKVIVFQLNDEEYTIPVDQVGSIERMMPITRVPSTAPFVKGVLNLRGIVTPVIDLRKRFDMEPFEQTSQTRIIVVTLSDIVVGMIVDAANDVLDLKEDTIEPPPKVIGTIEAEYIQGIAKLERRLLLLLDMDKVLSKEEIHQVRALDINEIR
ncbi:chemotaxis protein CheW [Halobacillus sp. BBL2006]|uniref:chemotaxis protein CheW n=1 Tax=Halobacillus sp. BBL2006 TaxID=1543706 RepID=UPI0005420ECA|nr:chemotaxis protein CheW [Halobacillus sp. BBL2006]KHE71277.1 chemotaxis protein CheW [Halobacillus sp. BBL2006]